MNKLLSFITICFLLTCLCSCSVEKHNNHSNEVYKISESIYTDNNETINQFVNIKYPQVFDLDDNYVEQSINDQIKAAALKVLDEFSALDEMNISVMYSLDCVSSNLLSLHFIRESFHSAQAYPLIRIIAISFDVGLGKKIVLNDVVNIDDNFIQSFFENFQLQGNYESLDEKSTINNYVSDIISIEKFYTCGEYLDSDYQCYFTDSFLFISIAVPYSVGSYALYEAKYSGIKDILKLNIYE